MGLTVKNLIAEEYSLSPQLPGPFQTMGISRMKKNILSPRNQGAEIKLTYVNL